MSAFVSLTVKSMASTFGSGTIVVSAQELRARDAGQAAALDDDVVRRPHGVEQRGVSYVDHGLPLEFFAARGEVVVDVVLTSCEVAANSFC